MFTGLQSQSSGLFVVFTFNIVVLSHFAFTPAKQLSSNDNHYSNYIKTVFDGLLEAYPQAMNYNIEETVSPSLPFLSTSHKRCFRIIRYKSTWAAAQVLLHKHKHFKTKLHSFRKFSKRSKHLFQLNINCLLNFIIKYITKREP